MPAPTLKAKATLDDTQFQRGLKRMVTSAGKAGKAIGRGFKTVGGALGRAGIAGAGAGGLAGGMLTKNTIKNTDALYRMSKMSGVAVRELAILQDVFEENGGTLETLSGSLVKMEKNLAAAAEGGTPLAKMLRDLGTDVAGFIGQKPAEQFIAFSKAIVGLGTPLERSALATATFGKSGAELIPILHAVADTDFTALNKEADALDGMAEKMHKLTVESTRTKDAFSQLGIGFAEGITPAIEAFNKWAQKKDFLGMGRIIGNFLDTPNKAMGFKTTGYGAAGGAGGGAQEIKAMESVGADPFAKFKTAHDRKNNFFDYIAEKSVGMKAKFPGSGALSSGRLSTGALGGGSMLGGGAAAFGRVRRGDAGRAKEARTRADEDLHSILTLLKQNLE